MSLTKNQIFALDDTKYKLIKVKAWDNAEIQIKTMTAEEKIEFMQAMEKKKNEMDLVLYLVVLCCVDNNKQRMFVEEDIPALKTKSSEALTEIAEECLKLSEMNAGAVENKAKN